MTPMANFATGTAGVDDTDWKFALGVSDTSGKFAVDVNNLVAKNWNNIILTP
jgi:hypothetical protein